MFDIIDQQIGDVNGDHVPDIVYLVGEKKENFFYENIKVIVQDGRTRRRYTISLDNKYSIAYTPWLFLGSFINLTVNEIMISMPVGGSGALTYYYVISFFNNKADVILSPESFMGLISNLKIEIEYMDDYKVLVKSIKLNQSYILDISDRKAYYEGTLYDKNGKLMRQQEGFLIDLPHLSPIRMDGSETYKLQAQDAIAGTAHADRLGFTITYWRYDTSSKSWVLDPAMFFVML